MSSILRALKKLEEEREARSARGVDVTKGILTRRRETERKRWGIPAMMAGVALISGIATYLLVRNPGRPSAPLPQAAGPAEVAPIRPSSSPVTALPTPQPASPPTASAPERRQSGAARPALMPAVKPREPRPAIGQGAQPVQPALSSAPQLRQALPALPPAQPEPVKPRETAPATPPSMRVTGIAWQQDGASRMAVVNGQMVREGGTVAGARVEGILPDRVRFSRDGRTFDVTMEK